MSDHSSAKGRAQDRGSSPAKDRRYTIVPRNQPKYEVDVDVEDILSQAKCLLANLTIILG